MPSPSVITAPCPTTKPCCPPEKAFLCDPTVGPPGTIDNAEPLWRSETVPTVEHPDNAGPKKWITSARPMRLTTSPALLGGTDPQVVYLYGRPGAEFLVEAVEGAPSMAECEVTISVYVYDADSGQWVLKPDAEGPGWSPNPFRWVDLLPHFPQQIATMHLEEGCIIKTTMRSRNVKYADPPGDPGDPGPPPPWGPPTGYSPDGPWVSNGTQLLFRSTGSPPPP